MTQSPNGHASQLLDRAFQELVPLVRSPDPLRSLISGLDALVRASSLHPDLATLDPFRSRTLNEMLVGHAPLVYISTNFEISEAVAALGLEAASGLLTEQADDLRTERLLHTMLLVTELRKNLARKELERRGNHFVKSSNAWKLYAAQKPDGDYLQ